MMFYLKVFIIFLILTLHTLHAIQSDTIHQHHQSRLFLSTANTINTSSKSEENESSIKFHLINQNKKISGTIEQNIIKSIKFGVKKASSSKFPNILISLTSNQITKENEIDVYCSPLIWLATKGKYPNQKLYHWRTSLSQGKDTIFISSENTGYENSILESEEAAAFMCSIISTTNEITEFELDIHLIKDDVNLIESEKSIIRDILSICCTSDKACMRYRKNETSFELDACQVEGNYCDENGNLLRLDMSSSGLNCSFPYLQLKNLTKLEKLYLDDNFVPGDVALVFENFIDLKKLKYVNLSKCNLHGSLNTNSRNMCDCFKNNTLKYVNLNANIISGQFPKCLFSDNSTIVEFSAAQNKLKGSLHDNIAKNSVLEALNLSYNQLYGYLPKSIGNAKKLKFLNLEHNKFSGPLPESLGSLHNLYIIRLSGNKFSKFPKSWDGHWSPGAKLKLIDISKNAIDSEFPKSLLKAVNIEYLDLSDNQLNGTLKSEQSMFQKCLYFNVSHNNFEGRIPDDFKSMKIFSFSTTINNIYCVFDLRNNNLTGLIPSFFYTKYAYPVSNKHIYISGNKLECRFETTSRLNHISRDIHCDNIYSDSNNQMEQRQMDDGQMVGVTTVSNNDSSIDDGHLPFKSYKKISIVDVVTFAVSGLMAIVILSGITVLIISYRRKQLIKRGLLYVSPQEIDDVEDRNRF